MSPKAIGPLTSAAFLILIVSADRVSAQNAAAQPGSPGLVLLPLSALIIRDRLDVPGGRALTVGAGLQLVVRDSALRFGGQVLFFEHALALRVTCAFVKGFD